MRGLRLLKPVKPSLYPSAPRRVKRTRIANQMKRVQRVEDSLAQVWGRAAPNGLPAENAAKPIWSRKNALCRAASVPRVPSFPRRDRRQKTRKPEVNQQSPITTRHPRTHEWRSRPTAEQERNIPQAVLFGAQAANSRRDRTQDISRETHDGREQTHDIPREMHDGREQTHDIPIESHDRHRTNTAPRESRLAAPPDPRAHNRFCRSISGRHKHFAGAQFTII